jgi:hypothetical protein
LRLLVRPEDLRQLLAVKTVSRGKGEQFDQILGLAETPLGLVNRPTRNGNEKPAKELNADLVR